MVLTFRFFAKIVFSASNTSYFYISQYKKSFTDHRINFRSEVSFNVAKSILIKICQKHIASFHPAINFFIANINYEEELGKFSQQSPFVKTCLFSNVTKTLHQVDVEHSSSWMECLNLARNLQRSLSPKDSLSKLQHDCSTNTPMSVKLFWKSCWQRF